MLLKLGESQREREVFLNRKWVNVNEEMALQDMVECRQIKELEIL
jgi:hypothetical protein